MNPAAQPTSSSVSPQPPQPDDFWPLLIQFVMSLKSWWGAICADFELTPVQGHALRSLDPDRPLAMSSLAENLACEPSNVTGIVDKLESRGYIARQSVGHDRRIKALVLTEEGRRVRALLRERMEAPPEAVASLAPSARQQLAVVLREVLVSRGVLKP